MSTIVDTAPASSPLVLMDEKPALFPMAGRSDPSVVTIPGSSSFGLTLLDVTAAGTVEAAVPGMITFTLYGMAKEVPSPDPALWLPLASCEPEPIGGETDLPKTMWMIQGTDLMIFPESGKMQGCFKSNVASSPKLPVDLTQHPGDITATDPLYIFAVGASFAPTGTPPEGALCTVTLDKFILAA